MSDGKIKQAQAAIKSGNRQEAYQLLRQVIQSDKTNHVPWLLLATIASEPETSLKLVKHAQTLQPDDPMVHKALHWAQRRLPQPVPKLEPIKETPDDKSTVTSPIPQQESTSSRAQASVPMPAAEDTAPSHSRRQRLIWGGVLVIAILALATGAIYAGSQFTTETVATDRAGIVSTPTETAADRLAQTDLSEQPAAQDEVTTAVSEADLLSPTATPIPPTATTQPNPIQPKNVAANRNEPRATWTLTPTPTSTPSPSPTPVPTFRAPLDGQPISRPQGVGAFDKWIRVNLTSQTLTAYEGDVPVFETLISSGLWQYPTVTGQFRVWLRYESQTMDGSRLGYDYYLENVPYVMYFFEDYALHGTFWHNNFGTPMSHGCVNLETNDAAWIFNWSTLGTVVYVHY